MPTQTIEPSSGSPLVDSPPPPRGRLSGGLGALLVLVIALFAVGLWHLTQGTSSVGPGDLIRLMLGDEDAAGSGVREILVGSRLPRLAAGITVGVALGVAGAIFQSISRNSLASPDTLAVTAGSALALAVVAAFGIAVPLWASGAIAFIGGILAAGLVLALSGGAGTSTSRLVLAGSATAMALGAGTSTLLILFEQETAGLFAWGNGSLSQLGLRAFWHAAPVVLAALVGGILLARRLDLLALGDDTAGVLGVPVRSTRVIGTLLAVLLTAAAVTIAGPIGFVGLCAPVAVRLLGRFVPALQRHGILLPASGVLGALIVLLADILMRAILGADRAIAIPTGVTTTLLGAIVLVALARRTSDSGATRRPAAAGTAPHHRRRFLVILAVAVVAAIGCTVGGFLAGNTWLRTGDLAIWLNGSGSAYLNFTLDERVPRVIGALAAGAALALSGTLVQSICRNPLAEPGILGITGGAGVGAVIGVTLLGAGTTLMLICALVGGLLTFVLVYSLAWRGGLATDRLVLVGVGVSAGMAGLSTFLLLRANPWDTPSIFTWLSGSTYGRSWSQVLPIAIAVIVAIPLAFVVRRELDLSALDDDTPRLAGVPVEPLRLALLTGAAVLAALSVVAVGTVAFVGLVAPHAARALVGGRHARSIPVAVLLGGALLVLADAIGRSVIAPAEIPAGLVVAVIGAPYFVYLLWRSRA